MRTRHGKGCDTKGNKQKLFDEWELLLKISHSNDKLRKQGNDETVGLYDFWRETQCVGNPSVRSREIVDFFETER